MKYLALYFAFLSSAFTAVDGTVVNRTTGKPQAGAVVALYKLAQQTGPEQLESVRTDAQGKFHLNQTPEGGPYLLQSVWGGVTYNHMLPPGSPTSDVELEVYEASTRPGNAEAGEHMILFEPSGDQLSVTESFEFHNTGNFTYNDPDKGTLRIFVPEGGRSSIRVTATAPQGMPVQHVAQKTSTLNVYMIDFPIKPGETRIDVTYQMPFSERQEFAGKIFYKAGPTRLVTPAGVTLEGAGIAQVGQEPQSQALIYSVKAADYKVRIAGNGSLRASTAAADEDSGPSIEQVLPKIYASKFWLAGLCLLILALGFVLLYRKSVPESVHQKGK
jgi:hypothetical protein